MMIKKLFITLIFAGVGIFGFTILVFAAPLYSPGDTLDPACSPNDTNCTVASPINSCIADSPLNGTGVSASHLSIPKATGSVSGYLDKEDWTTFANKLSSYTETDSVVKAINGLVKSNGSSISAAVAGTNYVVPGNIVIEHADGTETTYVASADTDAARGTTLETAMTATVAGDSITVGPGDYSITSALVVLDYQTITLKSSHIYNTTNTADIFTAVSKTNWTVQGNGRLQGSSTGSAYTDQSGIRITGTQYNWVISGLYFSGFGGSGISSQATTNGTPTGGRISNVRMTGCTYGLYVATRSEYNQVVNSEFYQNTTGVYVAGGNFNGSNLNIEANVTGVYLNDDGNNNGHGQFVGCNINHNTQYSIYVNGLTAGMDFVGCHIYPSDAAPIYLNSSKGVQFLGGQMGTGTTFSLAGTFTGYNIVKDVWFQTAEPTINGTTDQKSYLKFEQNTSGQITSGLGRFTTGILDTAAPTYTSVYPPAQNSTYVKASTNFSTYDPFNATDPTTSLTGEWGSPSKGWISSSGSVTNQRYHIDLGSSKVVTRIYYENMHNSGDLTNVGVKNFTFWGSNTAGDASHSGFADVTNWNDDSAWVQLNTNVSAFSQHSATNTVDPRYITVTNSTPYRYYAFKFADNYNYGTLMGVRRIELQTGSGGLMSIDTNGRKLYGTDGTTTILDWSGVAPKISSINHTSTTGAVEGMVGIDTSDHHFYGFSGTAWVQIDN